MIFHKIDSSHMFLECKPKWLILLIFCCDAAKILDLKVIKESLDSVDLI